MSTGFDAYPAHPSSSVEPPALGQRSETPLHPSSSATRDRLQRVLHLINGEHYAGAERVQDLLAACLPRFGYEVGFACVKPGVFPESRSAHHIPLYRVPMQSRFDLRSIGRLCQIVDEGGYTLIHAHTPRTAIVGRLLAARRGLPMVYHVHSPAARDSTRPWINNLNAMVERLSLPRTVHLIAVSQSLANHMRREGFNRHPITVVENGVPVVSPQPERGTPQGTWTLGTIALFRPRKGIEVLLEALSILRDQSFDVRLRAVGGFANPSYQQQVLHRARQLGVDSIVDWVGFQLDINNQLRQMDLFVLPSLFGEGLPMVVLEAMATGVPVIATDVEGVPEAVRDGLEGRIVPASDPQALARAVAELIKEPGEWPTFRRNAISRQIAHFSDASMAAGVARVYNEVLQSVLA